jgi:peptidase M28-like protein
MLRAAGRIVAGVTVGIAILWLSAWFVLRQPVMGRIPYQGVSRADAGRLRRDVEFLTREVRPRSAERTDNLDRAAAYIAAEFQKAGGRVREQEFIARRRTYRNVIADFGTSMSNEFLVIGAHYDAFSSTGNLPGADDNASGTAGLLEIARLFHDKPPRGIVELIAFANEEPPFFGSEEMGSAIHAQSLAGTQSHVTMICLEMIGDFHGRQIWPAWVLQALYPDRSDFVSVAGRWEDRALTRNVKKAIAGAGGIPVYSFTGPREMSDASDQRNYWRDGWTAVMVGDTAYLRNSNYHTIRDTAETLDYDSMARVVDGVYNAALSLSSRTDP